VLLLLLTAHPSARRQLLGGARLVARIAAAATPVSPPAALHALLATSAANGDTPLGVLPAGFAGVRRHSLLGALPAAGGGNASVPGVLHVHLKALRWPHPDSGSQGPTLRLKGFVAFEAATPASAPKFFLFSNVPEVALTLRLQLRSRAGNWSRHVPLQFVFSPCERAARMDASNYTTWWVLCRVARGRPEPACCFAAFVQPCPALLCACVSPASHPPASHPPHACPLAACRPT
jgi:hypothetical protein